MKGTDIALQAFQVLSPVLLAALTWLAGKAAQLVSARVKNEYLRGVLVRLDDTILSVVREVNQVTVDAIKAASVDGKLPFGARETIKQAALGAIKSHLGPKGITEMARVLGLSADGVDKLIGTKIEAAVSALKTESRVLNGVNHAAPVGDAPSFHG